MDDLIDALDSVREIASDVWAWHDNDGESTLNSFASSHIGGERSRELLEPIERAERLAREVLQFTQGKETLYRAQVDQLENSGYRVLRKKAEYVVVEILPTDEEAERYYKEENVEAEPMELVLIND
ncbi:hypothetical protein E0E52_17095 [Azotobacter chroococcum]|uniref:hypothetical protein n=1 Tax=Azotobacter chroococcum TaxID=353 RepID=UPI00103B1B12|nr:hypothetical protein [Azotobacter chroococcum]TBW02735.1 hypothetical protein E0E52_17095 [Azotobacter chroococcum]